MGAAFIGFFGMTSRALALCAFNMDVTVAPRLSAHQVPAPFLEEDQIPSRRVAYN